MTEKLSPEIVNRSQLILNKGVVEKLRKWEKERILTKDELTYLWLAQLTISRIENADAKKTNPPLQ